MKLISKARRFDIPGLGPGMKSDRAERHGKQNLGFVLSFLGKFRRKVPTFFLLLILLGLGPVGSAWAGEDRLFTRVPTGDETFPRLEVLADAGLLKKEAVKPPLTRFEVAELILEARRKLETRQTNPGIVVAQATGSDDLLMSTEQAGETSSAPASLTAEAQADAWKNLNSLEEAYQYELKTVKDQAESLKEGIKQTESDQTDLLKMLKGITHNPSVSIHGRGRGQGTYQRFSPPVGFSFSQPTAITGWGFLDLEPTGSVSKELRWEAMIRLSGGLLPDNSTNIFTIRRIELEFNPAPLSIRLGDFYEAYTPLTLWNRGNLDLKILPEMMARRDKFRKYESFLQNAPEWPLRGAKISADFLWPEGGVLERWKSSLFAHMAQNGYDSQNNLYFGSGTYTDWIFGGKTEISLRKGYFTGGPDLFSLEASSLLLDQALGTNKPGSPYISSDPSTWAHRYFIGSLKPKLEAGFGGGFALGATFEMTGSYYHDDKMDGTRTINDWAQLGGPYLKLDDSTLSFNFINVGPYYYVPTAQTRQDNPFMVSGVTPQFNFANSPEQLFPFPLKGQAVFPSISRPGFYFDFYDRTQDNVFPYGLATPNREGWGLDLDVKALEKKALRLMGSFYVVREMSGTLVVNPTGTGFDPVDAPPSPAPPVRDFTYLNTGASFNMGPLMGLKTDFEWTANVRMESTQSSIGKLDSLWILGGVRVGLFTWLEVSAAFGQQRSQGMEAGIQGSTFARYPFILDNSDLGNYSVFLVDGTLQSLQLSAQIKVSGNSRFYLDYSLNQGDIFPLSGNLPGMLVKQYGELAYEVEF